jgi:alpha-tubulin suppressor-like RCC1 family protein
MSFFKRLCSCCLNENDIEVDDSTRLLPPSSPESALIKRVDSPFTLHTYGVFPSDLSLKQIPEDFSKLGISKISCGAQHLLLLSNSNFVLVAGNNEYGQCARNPSDTILNEEGKSESLSSLKLTAFNIEKHKVISTKVLDIAAGAYHSVVLVQGDSYSNSTSTKVMVWGHPLGCGFSDGLFRFTPTEVPIDQSREGLSSVFAGQNRTAVLSDSGKVFVWGEWFTGTRQLKPREIPNEYPFKKIVIGKMFLSGLTNIGKVFAVGDNTYGELGLGREVKTTLKFLEVKEISQVVDLAAGARHSLFLTRDRRLFCTGDNSENQCAIGTGRSYLPIEVNVKMMMGNAHPEKVFCGEADSAVLTNEGDLFVWGDNTGGRLGVKGPMAIEKPRIFEDVIGKFVAGVGLGSVFTAVLVGPGAFNLARKSHLSEQLIPPN